MRVFLYCALFPLLLALAPPAGAQDAAAQSDEEILETVPVDEGTDSEPPPEDDDGAVSYSGIGLSRVSSEFDNLKEAINLDFVIGIRVPTINWISAEINFSTTIIPGENQGARNCSTTGGSGGVPLLGGGTSGSTSCAGGTFTRSGNDLQMNNIGVFAVLRSPGQFYAVGKLGYRFINSSIPEIQQGGDRTGTAYGAGGGYRWGRSLSGIEVLYTRYSDQLDYLGFNIAYGFGGRNR